MLLQILFKLAEVVVYGKITNEYFTWIYKTFRIDFTSSFHMFVTWAERPYVVRVSGRQTDL